MSKRFWPRSVSLKFPTLRFRGKIMLGFAVVLAISAVSMGIAYLGFERVSLGVAVYRNSVTEADLARNIDRELISYRGAGPLLRRDRQRRGCQGGACGRGQPERRHRSIDEGHHQPGAPRPDHAPCQGIQRLHQDFADILKVKRDSALVAQNQLARGGNMLRYKLDDLPSNADESELPAIEFGAKKVTAQFQTVTALANTFVINSDQAVAASALARLKFVENSLQAISSTDEKITQSLKEAAALLDEYRQALTKLIENAKEIDELIAEMADSAAAIMQGRERDEGGPAVRSATA